MKSFKIIFIVGALFLSAVLALLIFDAYGQEDLIDARGTVRSIESTDLGICITVDGQFGETYKFTATERCDVFNMHGEPLDTNEISMGSSIDVIYKKGITWRIFGKIPTDITAERITVYPKSLNFK